MILKAAICGIAMMILSSVCAAPLYQLPGLNVCNANNCQIVLDESGYVVDVISKKRIFAQPLERSLFNSYLLFRVDGTYVIEMDNSTSSKNWSVLIFSYAGGKVQANRYISLSRSFSPETMQWSGMECRGNESLGLENSPFESASKALCGKSVGYDLTMPGDVIVNGAAKNKGLVVEIPVYDKMHPQASWARYLFAESDTPDAGALLCLIGCGMSDYQMHFGGWIGKSQWIDMKLRDEYKNNSLVGIYFYVNKGSPIALDGWIDNRGKINFLGLNEYPSLGHGGTHEATAVMRGDRHGDSFLGTWSPSTSGKTKKTYELFLARRVY